MQDFHCRRFAGNTLQLVGNPYQVSLAFVTSFKGSGEPTGVDQSQLIYLHPPTEGPQPEWHGRGSGFVAHIPVRELPYLPCLETIAIFFRHWQPAQPIVIECTDQMARLDTYYATLVAHSQKNNRPEAVEHSLAFTKLHCSALLLTLRQLILDRLPHHPLRQPTRLLARFAELVERHFTEQGDVAFYARNLRVSSDHVSDVCRQYLGKGAKDYLQGRRFSEATMLLTSSDLSVKEIAYRVGFEDPAYFSRAFKKWSESTPLTYRQEHQSPGLSRRNK